MMEQKTRIIKEMILKSEEKLRMSKLLLDNKGYDDSVSRSYYAIFHLLSAVLFTKDLSFSSHKEVIGAFNKYFIKTHIFPDYFSKKIEQLFRLRQTGDYDVKKNIDEKTALECYKNAIEVKLKCTEYLSNIYKIENDF